jgi:hypothetical protein
MSLLKVNAVQTTSAKPILNSTGSIIQVVQVIPSPTAVVTNSNSYDTVNPTTANTALLFSGSITPTSSSSKVLVKLDGIFDANGTTSGETVCLFRSSSFLAASYWYRRVQGNETQPHIITYLDSPATTSSVQYDIRATTGSGWTLYINRNGNNTSNSFWNKLVSLTLFEVTA